jgi:drug/metabolite transporter (DMT)-like permease
MINGKFISIFIHSIFYVVNLSSYLILIKYLEITYSYKNFWFNTLLSIILCPLYLGYFCLKHVRTRLKSYGREIVFPILAGCIYTGESILLYYSINNLSLSFYTILRSSFIIWNIPFFIFFLQKKISRIYYFACILLLISYTLMIYYYFHINTEYWQPTLAILISCLLNSSYNIIIEYSVKQYSIYNLDYQIIFQLTYFCLAFIPSIKKTIENPPPVNITIIIISFFISISLQFYVFNKIIILHHENDIVPSNVLMSGLDILRRIILLLFSFILFKEEINVYIILSIVLFLLSGIFLFIEYLKPLKNKLKYNEMIEIV